MTSADFKLYDFLTHASSPYDHQSAACEIKKHYITYTLRLLSPAAGNSFIPSSLYIPPLKAFNLSNNTPPTTIFQLPTTSP